MTTGEGTRPLTQSSRQQAMVSLLRVAGHLRRSLEDICSAHGLTHDQYNVLRILRGAEPDGLPRFAVADRLIDRAPDVTRLLDRLERDGLVRRSRSREDRRLSISRVTPKGLRLLETIDPEILALHERLVQDLDEADVSLLSGLIGRLQLP